MKLKIAIVGSGAVAEDKHIPAALGMDEVELVSVVDTDINQALKLAGKFEISSSATSIGEIANKVDAVIIATPPHVRPGLAQDAFKLGLHVLCEKPMANTVAECQTIIEAARRADRVLAIGHMFRFWPTRIRIHEFIHKKTLGQLKSIVATEGKPYQWQSVTGYTVRKKLTPGGVLINAGLHTLDTLLWWLGDPEHFEYEDDAVGGLESNVRMTLYFNRDIKTYFRISRTCHLPYEIQIECEKGTILLPTNSISKYTVFSNGGTQDFFCSDRKRDQLDNLKDQLRDFINSIIKGTPPRVSGKDGMRVIELIESCYRAKQSRPLPKLAPQPGLTW